jgi:hypothetical protein
MRHCALIADIQRKISGANNAKEKPVEGTDDESPPDNREREPGDDRQFADADDVDRNDSSDQRNPSLLCAQCNQPIAADDLVQSWFGGYQWNLHKDCVDEWRKRYRT